MRRSASRPGRGPWTSPAITTRTGLFSLFAFEFGAPLGHLVTWVAGVPAINSSDTDMIESSAYAALGILIGLGALGSERRWTVPKPVAAPVGD